ncbi:hypothetical protein A9179_03255 [Pseudomonas alcaligenes]|uniref:Uncharacterized protein n=1 Tax=Aquipseudomonas alcaligenes TaxID=43263 RepID=A0ABR7RWX4_AQUAC|nr:hypothetical protein [Pseudomonas alcaligenes]MBC9249289.1 hypothetical protein [Pseudomonas alcaligenes]
MRVLSILCLLTLLQPALASELDGHYQATLDGQPAELILHSQDAEVSGEYIENHRLRLNLRGQFDGQTLQAQISDPRSGQVLANMNANYASDMLNASIAARDPGNGQTLVREALFQRMAVADEPPPSAGPTAVAATELATVPVNPDQDPALVGTWIYEQMTTSSGEEFASLSSVTTLRIRADGSIDQWRRTVAGGSEWSYDRPGELQYSGRWRSADGLLLVQLQGSREYQPAARYHFSEPFLVTESNTGQMTWQRR